MLDQTTLNELKARLAAKRDELQAELATMTNKDPRGAGGLETIYPVFSSTQEGPVDEDAEIDEAEAYSTALALTAALEKDFTAANAALERIIQGTYGQCLNCGRDIVLERLRALPEADKCHECANK